MALVVDGGGLVNKGGALGTGAACCCNPPPPPCNCNPLAPTPVSATFSGTLTIEVGYECSGTHVLPTVTIPAGQTSGSAFFDMNGSTYEFQVFFSCVADGAGGFKFRAEALAMHCLINVIIIGLGLISYLPTA